MKKELKTFTADIHIHTPASKCYKGAKVESEYLEIVKTAKKKNLDIIAISDHNSIEGYSILFEQKNVLLSELEALKKISDSVQAQKRIKEIKKTLSYFQGLLILPAIEFEVNNGIHLLVIFNPSTSISIIKHFLEKGGYTNDSFGLEKSETISNWSIFDLYEVVKEYDCIVIDGHTDSDKGILNTIPKGTTRAHALKNLSLSGVCYKNERQRKLLENTLKSSVEYQRDRQLAFLKSSDAHNINEIGKSKTFFILENLDWNNFKKSFENPTEYIFTTLPKVKDIVDNIINNENYVTILSTDEISLDKMIKSVCALNNTNGGYIIFGMDESDSMLGIDIKDNKFENFEPVIKTIFNELRRVNGGVKFDFNFYPLQNEKLLIIFKIFKNERLLDIDKDGVIYSMKENAITVLSAEEIQKHIENNTIENIEKRIQNNLKVIEQHTSLVKISLKSLPALNTFIINSISLHSIINEPNVLIPIKLEINAQKALIEYSEKFGYGKSRGNILYFEEETMPRLNDAFLRYSLPKFFSSNLIDESKNIETIYVVPGGGVFYSKKTIPQFNLKGLPVLALNIDKESNYSTKFLCAYLKSSFLLWFLLNKYDNVNIYEPEIFNKLIVPKIDLNKPEIKKIIQKIETDVDNIIMKENEFLKTIINEKNRVSETIKHNSEIDKYAINIDKSIYELLSLNKETQEVIEGTLKANQIHYPINN